MKYDFDKMIDRANTSALSVDGFRDYLFGNYENLELGAADKDLVKMWVADMEFETAPEILNAIRRRVDHGIFGYTLSESRNYGRSVVQWIEDRHGYRFDPSHMVYSKGVIPALFYLFKQLCLPGDKAMIMTPSYGFFKHAADANGTELVYSRLIKVDGQYRMDFDTIRKQVADPQLSTLVFCNPHNPTGRLWTEHELKSLGEICLANDVTIVSDEIHCDLVRQGSTFVPFQKLFPHSDQIITCISASKTFNLAGMQLANTFIPNEKLRQQWQADHLPVENPLSLAAYEAAYTDGGAWLHELTDYVDANFRFVDQYLREHLPLVNFGVSESTYLAWVDVGPYVNNHGIEDLTLFFAQRGGILLEGANMFVDNGAANIRLNLACPRSRVEVGMARIVKAIKSLG